MSHDRGCFRCGRDSQEYRSCTQVNCVKKHVVQNWGAMKGKNNMFGYGKVINDFAQECYQNSVDHGFYEVEYNLGEKIALMHSELSEALEYARKDITAPSEKIPTYSGFAEELADVIIRVLDTAAHLDIDIGGAIMAKHQYNKSRPYKHGKKF